MRRGVWRLGHVTFGRYLQNQRRGDRAGVVHHRRQPVPGSFHRWETRRFGRGAKRPVYGAGTHRKRNEGGGQKEWTDR
nr:MAG TPA: hypothetical protein [Caudoviricetes sp.]